MARYLVGPVGGAVNMLLVLAGLIASAAVIVAIANKRVQRRFVTRPVPASRDPIRDSMRQIARSPYLRLMAALVFLVAIATQWTAFQLSLVADERFAGDADALTRVLRDVQLHARGDQLRPAAARDRSGAAPLRHGRHRPRPAAVARFWHVTHLAVARLVVGAHHERVRPGVPLLGRQGELRAAVSADSARAAHPAQEHDRHHREPRGGRMRRAAARPRDAGLHLDSRARPGFARHGGDQHGRHRRVGGRRLAAASGVRANDPRKHPSPSPRHRTSGVGDDREVGSRGAAGEARG